MIEKTGWLLDLYPDPGTGACILWLLGEDGGRYRFFHLFPVTFYAAGAPAHLRALWQYLKKDPVQVNLSRVQRRDLFQPEPVTVLKVDVQRPSDQSRLFNQVAQAFSDLTYYNADLQMSLRHAALFDSFPLARCRITAADNNQVLDFTTLDSPWEIDISPPPLRTLFIEPDSDPRHAEPQALLLRFDRQERRLALEPARPLLITLSAIIRQYDPDFILTAWGDGWLLPALLDRSENMHIPLPLNRDTQRSVSKIAERSYFSYGQVIHRDQQIHLFGRMHVDIHNAMLYHDYGLEGVFELSRITAMPLQSIARMSPGSGVSAMEIITALRMDVLVPWHKQHAEYPKTALQLMRSDQGGMVYQPIIGLHQNVAELDFVSMYPSIMVHCNISPETIVPRSPEAGPAQDQDGEAGLIPQTLAPLLEKRMAIKQRLATMSRWDARRQSLKARASAHKWVLVTSFGYLGYKNARFGRIEAHEAVTMYSREALLRAKEAAEDLGFTVLHLYVDGLWICRSQHTSVTDVQPVMDEILARTGLPIALEGIYKWVAFLPSRVDPRVPVANRYFGVFEDGTIKSRGIDSRRRDTSRWVASIQTECLERLAKEPSYEKALLLLPEIAARLRKHIQELAGGRVPLETLVVSQKLSRAVAEYRSPSPAARAAAQLESVGKTLRPGQMIAFLYTLGSVGVHAWDLPQPPKTTSIDIDRYATLLLRAASTITQPFGLDETDLRRWIFTPESAHLSERPYAVQMRLPDILARRKKKKKTRLELPTSF
jgi:DNA polymerase II